MTENEKSKILIRYHDFVVLQGSKSYDVAKCSISQKGKCKGKETLGGFSYHVTLGTALAKLASWIRSKHLESKAPMTLEELVKETREINIQLKREFDIRG
jgi:hypothetical protein